MQRALLGPWSGNQVPHVATKSSQVATKDPVWGKEDPDLTSLRDLVQPNKQKIQACFSFSFFLHLHATCRYFSFFLFPQGHIFLYCRPVTGILKVLFVCLFVWGSVFSSSPSHLPVSATLPLSLRHAPEVLNFLEGRFYACLVPNFCSCCPGDTPQWLGPHGQRVCVPGSQGTITTGKLALSRLCTASRTLFR